MPRYSLLSPEEVLDPPSEDHADTKEVGEILAVEDVSMDAALAERLQLEELFVQDDETEALALQYEQYATGPVKATTSPPKHQNGDSSLAKALQLSEYDLEPATATPAQVLYRNAFPYGHKILQTPGTNMRCGLYAIILSYANQYPSRSEQPTMEALIAVVNSVRYRSIMSRPQTASSAHEASVMAAATRSPTAKNKKGKLKKEAVHEFLQNDRYFSPDQLDLLLRFWGEQNGLRLRLGYVHDGEAKLLSRGHNDEAGDVVWIHFNRKGAGHYSGLAVKKAPNADSAAVEGWVKFSKRAR